MFETCVSICGACISVYTQRYKKLQCAFTEDLLRNICQTSVGSSFDYSSKKCYKTQFLTSTVTQLRSQVQLNVRYLFHDRYSAALPEMHWFIGRISMIVCCYFRSAAVKVMTLLMLPVADTRVSRRMTAAVL